MIHSLVEVSLETRSETTSLVTTSTGTIAATFRSQSVVCFVSFVLVLSLFTTFPVFFPVFAGVLLGSIHLFSAQVHWHCARALGFFAFWQADRCLLHPSSWTWTLILKTHRVVLDPLLRNNVARWP